MMLHPTQELEPPANPARFIVTLFASFILLCGLAHLVSLATLWIPVYALEGVLKLVTGIVSATTAIVLFRLVPTLIAIPSPREHEQANARLRQEVSAHEATLAELLEAKRTLEDKVEERTSALRTATEELSILSREAMHRSRNLLTVVGSIARQTARTNPDIEKFIESFLGRINALGNATTALIETRASSSLSMRQLAERQLKPVILTFGPRLIIEGPEAELNPQAAQQISLVLHELATNSQKHGVLSLPQGEARISWVVEHGVDDPRFVMTWEEPDGPKREGLIGGGFGSTLLLRIAPAMLGGHAEANISDGFYYRLVVPLDQLQQKTQMADHAEELARKIVDEAWGPAHG